MAYTAAMPSVPPCCDTYGYLAASELMELALVFYTPRLVEQPWSEIA